MGGIYCALILINLRDQTKTRPDRVWLPEVLQSTLTDVLNNNNDEAEIINRVYVKMDHQKRGEYTIL